MIGLKISVTEVFPPNFLMNEKIDRDWIFLEFAIFSFFRMGKTWNFAVQTYQPLVILSVKVS